MNIMAIGFYGNTITQLNALKATGWCDIYYLHPNELIGGIAGTIEDLEGLNIQYKKYDAAIIFSEALEPAEKYFNEHCIKHNITIYGNQHGFNKSIKQIVNWTPNSYSKYWNCMGEFFIDRFKDVMGRDPITQRWISVGSLLHDYLYKNYSWKENNNNGKALIIHEPDLSVCEGDPHPHDSEKHTKFIIESLIKADIEADLKPHPNWRNFIGNTGGSLEKPQGVNLVDIRVEDIADYTLVIGSRSTMLLDACAMGIPTIALESKSDWGDDSYPPVEGGKVGLIPTYSEENFREGLRNHFNNKPHYDKKEINYFLGPLGKVADNYFEFIENDFCNPVGTLGKYYFDWEKNLKNYRERNNIFFKGFKKIKSKVKRIINI